MIWLEAEVHSVEDGGNKWFGVGGFYVVNPYRTNVENRVSS